MSEFRIKRLVLLSRAQRMAFALPEATYPTWSAIIPVRGRFSFAAPSVWHECAPGSLALCPPDVSFRRRMRRPTEFFHAHFTAEGPPPGQDGLVTMGDWTRIESTLHHLREAIQAPGRALDVELGTHLLRDLFLCVRWRSAATAKPDAAMAEAARILEERAAEPVRVSDVARRFRLPPPTFSRRFHAAHGVNPREFLIQRRLARASALLRDTDWTHDHIAQVCGWPNAFYFSRQFRARFGLPPSEWRREHRV